MQDLPAQTPLFPTTRRENVQKKNVLLQVYKKLREEKDTERYARCTEQVKSVQACLISVGSVRLGSWPSKRYLRFTL